MFYRSLYDDLRATFFCKMSTISDDYKKPVADFICTGWNRRQSFLSCVRNYVLCVLSLCCKALWMSCVVFEVLYHYIL